MRTFRDRVCLAPGCNRHTACAAAVDKRQPILAGAAGMLHHMLPPSYCIGKTVNGSTDETEQKPYDNETCPERIFLIDTIILCPTEDCNPVCYSSLTIWCDEWVKNILFLAKRIEKLTPLVYNITNTISYGGDFCGKKRAEYRPYRGGCCRAYC